MNKTEAINQAKHRLIRMSLIQPGDESIYLYNKKLTLSEVAVMRENILVKEEAGEYYNPIEILADRQKITGLDDEDKVRYLLELSALYRYLKKTMKNT